MTQKTSNLMVVALAAVTGIVGGFGGAAIWDVSGLGGGSTREYLLSHPEVLPEAMQALQQRETAQRMAGVGPELKTAYPGAVLGNPNGSITLVEFSDYACGYCKMSVADVEQLVAANPDLKVVIREYPILSAASADAARMALAAADQGKFEAFHKAMYAKDRPNQETIEASALEAGMDLEAAKAAIAAQKYEGELMRNVTIANNLGFDGTPAWVVGDKALNGAVGHATLAAAVEEARDL